MSEFSNILGELRRDLGFSSMKSFYDFFSTELAQCPVNYPYYSKIEKGEKLPSASVVEGLASIFESEKAELLILSYCRSLFSSHEYLFPEEKLRSKLTQNGGLDPLAPAKPRKSVSPRTELSLKQISLLGQSKAHYYLFLLGHMIDESLSFEECRQLLKSFWKPRVAQVLASEGLIQVQDKTLAPYRQDLRLPEAYNNELREIYKSLDRWDRQFQSDMDFSLLKDKVIFRRISKRKAKLIDKHIDLLIDLVREADEVDPRYNEAVHFLNIRFSKLNF